MDQCVVVLKPREEERILKGHTWVFSNEVGSIKGDIKSGELAYVYSSKGEFIGKGYLNTASKIFVRILTNDESEVIDQEFFRSRIELLKRQKEELGYQNSYRLCFGEADGIPGLIIDKFGDYFSIQFLSLGIDQRKQMFVDILVSLFKPLGIYERDDVPVRRKEGLEELKGTLYGEVPDGIIIKENHLLMSVDIPNGQKTGFFLDQQDNHKAIEPYVKNKVVLDCFANVGGFGLHAASYGAKEVVCVDSSQKAVDSVRNNAELNRLTQVTALQADVFDLLRKYQDEGKVFDTIVLDPPAFAKSKDSVEKAFKGYKEINLQAMKILKDGGILYTCSCSHFMSLPLFMEMVSEAANDADKTIHLLELRTQSKDHAALFGSDESLYLKCMIVRVTLKNRF